MFYQIKPIQKPIIFLTYFNIFKYILKIVYIYSFIFNQSISFIVLFYLIIIRDHNIILQNMLLNFKISSESDIIQ